MIPILDTASLMRNVDTLNQAVANTVRSASVPADGQTSFIIDVSVIFVSAAIILSIVAVVLAVVMLMRQNAFKKQILSLDEQLRKLSGSVDGKLNSTFSVLKKECASATESQIADALRTFEMKIENQGRISREKSAQEECSSPVPAYQSKTFYTCFMQGKFDELDFSDLQEQNLAFVVKTTSDTTAEVTLSPDFDRNLAPEVRDACDVAEGSWQSFNSVTVVSAGEISKPSKDAQKWTIVKKIVVKLS